MQAIHPFIVLRNCRFMAESGMDTKEFRDWQREASGNVRDDGMFSIQVGTATLDRPILRPCLHVPILEFLRPKSESRVS